MKIIFDNIIFSQQKAGGISVVWYEILKRVLINKDISPFFIEYKKCNNNLFRRILDIPSEKIIYKNQFLLKIRRYLNPIILLKEKTIFHSSYYRTINSNNAINITTVHDFTYERYYQGIAKWLHCNQKYQAIRNSSKIICISENTKQDLLKYMPDIDKNKIQVIYNGVSDDYYRIKHLNLKSLPFPVHSYIIFVGSRIAYKRFDLSIDVLTKNKFNLVIVGGGKLTNKECELLNTKIGIDRYKYIGSVQNKQLNQLYNGAFCLFYPSEYEGFGIPVLESQKAGCPVIAFNGSSIKEIAGKTALLFNEHSIDEINSCISTLFDNSTRNSIILEGIKNANKYSWDITFTQLTLLYTNAFNIE